MVEYEKKLQDLVKENTRLTRENNRLLKKLWRAHVLSFWSRVLFLVVIVGLPIVAYRYFLADYIAEVRDNVDAVQEKIERLPLIGD